MRQLTISGYLGSLRDWIAGKDQLKVVANVELCRSLKGLTFYESAIVLILLLIFLNSAVLGGAVFAGLYSLETWRMAYVPNLFPLFILSFMIAILVLVVLIAFFWLRLEKNDAHIKKLREEYKRLESTGTYEDIKEALSKIKSDDKLF